MPKPADFLEANAEELNKITTARERAEREELDAPRQGKGSPCGRA
jgi:hypothetical protein